MRERNPALYRARNYSAAEAHCTEIDRFCMLPGISLSQIGTVVGVKPCSNVVLKRRRNTPRCESVHLL